MEKKEENFGIGSHNRIKGREAYRLFVRSLKVISKLAEHQIRLCYQHSLAVIQCCLTNAGQRNRIGRPCKHFHVARD